LNRDRSIFIWTPYPTYLVNDVQGVAKLLLRRWKRGMAEYRSVIFTKTNGAINRLEDLRGKLLVFKDPESTSGYFLPKSPQLSPPIRTANG
jgi:phosphonate transport system substrate-binding protein